MEWGELVENEIDTPPSSGLIIKNTCKIVKKNIKKTAVQSPLPITRTKGDRKARLRNLMKLKRIYIYMHVSMFVYMANAVTFTDHHSVQNSWCSTPTLHMEKAESRTNDYVVEALSTRRFIS